MHLLISTKTGSKHFIDTEKKLYVRVPDENHDDFSPLRFDGEYITVHAMSEPEVGAPLALWLEPLAEEAVLTYRVTSWVTSVEELPE